MLLFILVWFISILFVIRSVLLITGLLKGPILHRFEKYGDRENFLPFLTPLLAWLGLFVILSNFLLLVQWQVELNVGQMGLAFIIIALLAYRWPHWFSDRYGLLFNHPRWLAEITGRTTRAERRRLAYMWLRLPFKLRVIYNSSDRAFMEWADMVILSSFWP